MNSCRMCSDSKLRRRREKFRRKSVGLQRKKGKKKQELRSKEKKCEQKHRKRMIKRSNNCKRFKEKICELLSSSKSHRFLNQAQSIAQKLIFRKKVIQHLITNKISLNNRSIPTFPENTYCNKNSNLKDQMTPFPSKLEKVRFHLNQSKTGKISSKNGSKIARKKVSSLTSKRKWTTLKKR